MKIERIEDKVFQITLSDAEADRLADAEETNMSSCKIMGLDIGRWILHYMIGACMFPHLKQPPLDTEL